MDRHLQNLRDRRPWAVAVSALVALTLLAVAALAPPASAQPDDSTPAVSSNEDSELQAAVLAAEDRRLVEIRTITSLARWQGKNWKTPYRLGTAAGYTLVLTPRSAPYTVDDLLSLAPQTFQLMSDGSFLLSEHVVVLANATLDLAAPGGLELRLASGHNGFATIVSLGGKVEVSGEQGSPVQISSWDVDANDYDSVVTDGRAYIRSIGGQFQATYLEADHLGFWSGRTGGIALTGTDRPNTGAIISSGIDDSAPSGQPSLLDGVTYQDAGPIGEDPSLGLDDTVPALDYVSSHLSNVVVEHNAFGLFVSGANGVQVLDSTFTANELGGVVFHRYVTNGVVSRTTSNDNTGDGFTLARATTSITISESTANNNTGNGFSLDGRALADGPSATGASLRSYGNNSVANSTATDNAHYGIEVSGGFNVSVLNNRIEGHDMGVMVNGPGDRISVTGNSVRGSGRHGVALVNGITDSTVTGNVIDDASTGVYVRDGSVRVTGNTVVMARSHGVSVIGSAEGAEVSYNVLGGSGDSALDLSNADGKVSTASNNLDGWTDTTPWYLWFKKLLRPMNLLWMIVAILIVVSALRRQHATGEIGHPYADQLAMFERMSAPTIDLTDEPRSTDRSEDRPLVDFTGRRATVVE